MRYTTSSLCFNFQTLRIQKRTKNRKKKKDFLVAQKVHFNNTANSIVEKCRHWQRSFLCLPPSTHPKSSEACHVLSEDASWLTSSVFSLILDLEHRIVNIVILSWCQCLKIQTQVACYQKKVQWTNECIPWELPLYPSSHFWKVVCHFNSAVQKLKHYLPLHSTRCKKHRLFDKTDGIKRKQCFKPQRVVDKITQWSWTNINTYWLPSQHYAGHSKTKNTCRAVAEFHLWHTYNDNIPER